MRWTVLVEGGPAVTGRSWRPVSPTRCTPIAPTIPGAGAAAVDDPTVATLAQAHRFTRWKCADWRRRALDPGDATQRRRLLPVDEPADYQAENRRDAQREPEWGGVDAEEWKLTWACTRFEGDEHDGDDRDDQRQPVLLEQAED